eukprot:TRINITY_DN14805_c0_g1_i1.p1 TRINITY_DN14805_c0_g1~~TRINITY_DN14805_c0_g1_i1.p1  ORF type:complete len:454 (+),score=76.63 TRINITY_DN14805_c0_g1_i1:140-1501(+)
MLFHNEGLISFTEAVLGIAATISAESLSDLEEKGYSKDFNQIVFDRVHYFGYALASFQIITVLRRGHIQMYRFIAHGNHVVMALNFVELAMICMLPVAFIGLELTDKPAPIALAAGLAAAIFFTRLIIMAYAKSRSLWGQPLSSSTHGTAIQSSKDADGDYLGGLGLVPGHSEAYTSLRAQFLALGLVASIVSMTAAFTSQVAGIGLMGLLITPRLLRMVRILPPVTADMLGWDKPRFELFRDAVFSIIGSLLALSMDPSSFFHGDGADLVPVVAAYVAGIFVTGVLFIVNFTMIHHLTQLHKLLEFGLNVSLGCLLIIPFAAKLYTFVIFFNRDEAHKVAAGTFLTGSIFALSLFQLIFWLVCLHTKAASIASDSTPADLHNVTLNALTLPLVSALAFGLSFATYHSTWLLALVPVVWTLLIHIYGQRTQRAQVLERRLLTEGESLGMLTDA